MKNMIRLLTFSFVLSSSCWAAPHKIVDSYSGPIFRALMGDGVATEVDGSRTVRGASGQVLIQCTPNEPSKGYNDYQCLINFDSVHGGEGKIVHNAINGEAVIIRTEDVVQSPKCTYMHCQKITQLSCSAESTCSINSYVDGWDE